MTNLIFNNKILLISRLLLQRIVYYKGRGKKITGEKERNRAHRDIDTREEKPRA